MFGKTYRRILQKFSSFPYSRKARKSPRLFMAEILEDRSLLSGASIVSMSRSGTGANPETQVTVTFDEIVQPGTFNTGDVAIVSPDGTDIALSGSPVDSGDQQSFLLNFASQSLPGTYRVSIGPNILDVDGNQMNQDGDGTNGETSDSFAGVFTVETTAITQFPYVQNFEGGGIGSLTSGWSFSTTGNAVIDVTSDDNPAEGQGHLRFDALSHNDEADAILKLDLTSEVGATDLTFDLMKQNVNSNSFLRFYVSNDGQTWLHVETLSPTPANQYFHVGFDLDAALTTHNITFDSDVYLRLSHDPFNLNEEMSIDQVRIARGLDVLGPAITSQSPNAPVTGPISFVDVTFDEAIDASSFTASDVSLTDPLGNVFGLTGDPVDAGDQLTWRLNFAAQSLPGDYQISVGPDVLDVAGNAMKDGDGINGDEAYQSGFTVETTAIAQFPYVQNFEGNGIGSLVPGWSFATTGNSVIEVTGEDNPAEGQGHLRFAALSSNDEADAILKLDLASEVGATDLTLDFMKQNINSNSYLRFYVSNDGVSWSQVKRLSPTPANQYFHVGFDLDEALATHNITLDSDVYLRLSHAPFNLNEEMSIDQVRIARGLDVLGPAITSQSPSAPVTGPISFVDVTFDEAIDPNSFTASDVSLTDPLGNAISLTGDPVDSGDHMTWRLSFAAQSLPGDYQISVGPDVLDVAGNAMKDGDGINGDEAYQSGFTVEATPIAQFPYVQNFEGGGIGSLVPGWAFSTSGNSVIEVTGEDNPAEGQGHLRFDPLGGTGEGDVILKLDLTSEIGATDLVFDFMKQNINSNSYLRFYVSNDGVSWSQVERLSSTPANQYFHVGFDLDEVLATHNITFDSDVYLRLQHDPFNLNDELSIDQVRIARGLDVLGPAITSQSPNTPVSGPISFIDVTFNEAIDPSTFTASDVSIIDPLGNAISLTGDPVDSGNQKTWRLNIPPQTQPGEYQLSIGPNVLDVAGNPMNQDADAISGEVADWFLSKVYLSPVPASNLPFFEDFEGETFSSLENWGFSTSDPGSLSLTGDFMPHSGDQHLRFTTISPGTREAYFSVDLTAHSTATDLWLDYNLKALSTRSSNYLNIAVSGDGVTWSSLQNVTTEIDSYENKLIDLDQVLANANITLDGDVYIRFSHPVSNSGRMFVLDDVRVARGEALSLEITPDTISESTTSTPTLRITRPEQANLSTELIVNLSSSDTSEVTVPGQVTIPANVQFIDVPLTIHDDASADGLQRVLITASGAGFGSEAINIEDDEPHTLALETSGSTVSEGAGPEGVLLTVIRNRDFGAPLTVNLQADDVTELAVPASITIPAGSDRISFYVSTNNDGLIDGTQTVVVTATATNFVNGDVAISVVDDDTAQLKSIGGEQYDSLPADDYTVLQDLSVPASVTWSIGAGSNLKFESGTGLEVIGTLLAQGTLQDKIRFESAAVSPQPGDWDGIAFRNIAEPRSYIEHGLIQHANRGVSISGVGSSTHVTIRNSEITSNAGFGIYIHAGGGDHIWRDDVVLDRNEIHHNDDAGIYVGAGSSLNHSGSASPTISSNRIFDNMGEGIRLVANPFSNFLLGSTTATVNPFVIGNELLSNQTGISLYGSETTDSSDGNAAVRGDYVNNLIADNLGDGVHVAEASPAATLQPKFVNNTIASNGAAGFRIEEFEGTAQDSIYANNIVYGNLHGFVGYPGGNPAAGQIHSNLVFGNTGGDWVDFPSLFGNLTTTNSNGTPADTEMNISVDPQFVSATDYHLQATSPAINAGNSDATGTPSTDFDGETRVGPNDIGFDEVNLRPTLGDSTFSLAENSGANAIVGSVNASDPDVGQNLSYAITGGNINNAFAIDNNGQITVNNPAALDFEGTPTFNLTVTVTDDGTSPLNDTATITVNLTNVNEPPVASNATFSLPENSANSTVVGSVSASDVDAGTSLSYAITSGNTNNAFAIDSNGQITVNNAAALDFESTPTFTLTVNVTDNGTPQLDDDATITINLTDVNENPVADDATFSLPENSANSTVVGTVSASDADGDTLSYAITGGNISNAFAIDSNGQITVNNATALDFETSPTFTLTVDVTDDGTPQLSDAAIITINLLNVNEAPVVDDATFSLSENSANNTVVGSVSASDVDADTSLGYTISSGNTNNAFAIDSNGQITVNSAAALDFETNPTFTLTVTVTDDGSPQLDDEATVTINLTDVNDAPIAADATFSLAENSGNSTAVGSVSASDADGDPLSYAITAGNTNNAFAIDNNGQITVNNAAALDFETTPTFTLTVDVTDDGTPQLRDAATITINLSNVNEAPVADDATFSLPENSTNNTVVGSVSASDVDAGTSLSYAITAGNTNNAFAIDSNGQITVNNAAALDFETNPTFTLTVGVTDDGSPQLDDEATITINLTDANDAPSAADATFGLAENSANNTIVGTVSASDVDGDTLTYAITGGNAGNAFAIDSNGQITVNNAAVLDYETNPTFALTVTVTDDGSPQLNDDATITINLTDVNDSPIADDATFSLPENSANSTIVGSVSASDADGDTLAFSITAGNTGNAFAIDSNGQITVNNAAALDFETNPTFTLTFNVTDNGAPQLDDEATITINLSDVNENPVVADQTFNFTENRVAPVGLIAASDPDANTTLSYSILSGNTSNAFAIDSNGQIIINNSAAIDFETNPTFSLLVQVTDDGNPQLSSTAVMTMNLIDVNEDPVIDDATFVLPEKSANSTVVGTVSASDVDGDSLTYAITAGNTGNAFAIDNNGQITVNDVTALDFETNPTFSLTVTVTDDGTPQLDDNATVTINLTEVDELGGDVFGRLGGNWWVARSNGVNGFTNEYYGQWDLNAGWVDVQTGDFNNDGLTDIAGRNSSGQWWVARNSGSNFSTEYWGYWDNSLGMQDVRVADVDGDGDSDIVGRSSTGQWWVARSNGSNGFTNELWGSWVESAGWDNVMVADLNNDGKDDIIGQATNGQWWAAQSNGSSFSTEYWGYWVPSGWQDVQVADVDNDGDDDVVGRNSTGSWWVARSNGSDAFVNEWWGGWVESAGWDNVMVADLNGDGNDDIIGQATNGQWWAAQSNGSSFSTEYWGYWVPSGWQNVNVIDVNQDGNADVVGRTSSGDFWVAISNGTDSFVNQLWGNWLVGSWQNVMVGNAGHGNIAAAFVDFDDDEEASVFDTEASHE